MKAVEIKKGIYWVGGVDWDLRNFHGYLTPRGSTYNAYLVIDEKVTLIDTVKHYLYDEMISRISSVIDPSKIDYVVSNHVEMDHSGGLPKLMELIPNATVFASAAGEKGLRDHYKKNWKFQTVKNGDVIRMGKRSLKFVMTPMIHWPDNMVGYMEEEKILFSNDAFGQHLASYERFDDEIPLSLGLEEAQKYYGNIVMSYAQLIQKALEQVGGLPIEMIAPSHGIIWRKHVSDILKHYDKWSSNRTDEYAVIVYDTMWESTRKMAHAIYEGFEKKGIKAKLMHLQANHISDVLTELVTAKYVCVGSPTLNSNMLPTVAGFLTYLKALSSGHRIAIPFGSYGWGGQSITQVADALKACDFQVLEPIKMKYVPDEGALKEISAKVESMISGLSG